MTTTPSSPDASDKDLAAIEASSLVKASSATHGIAGVTVALTGIQFVTSGSFYEWSLNLVPWALVLLGVVQAGVALLVLRNHHPAAIAGVLVGGASFLGSLAWIALIAWLATQGAYILSIVALASAPAAGAAALLAPFTLSHTKRGWEAKKRLQAAGIELGF